VISGRKSEREEGKEEQISSPMGEKKSPSGLGKNKVKKKKQPLKQRQTEPDQPPEETAITLWKGQKSGKKESEKHFQPEKKGGKEAPSSLRGGGEYFFVEGARKRVSEKPIQRKKKRKGRGLVPTRPGKKTPFS